LAICWLLAVPVRLCSEYLLFRQISTELPVTIGSGRASREESGETVWFEIAAGEDWDGTDVLACGDCAGEVAQAAANNTMTAKLNRSVFLKILTLQIIHEYSATPLVGQSSI